jgi:hypothetical protein
MMELETGPFAVIKDKVYISPGVTGYSGVVMASMALFCGATMLAPTLETPAFTSGWSIASDEPELAPRESDSSPAGASEPKSLWMPWVF